MRSGSGPAALGMVLSSFDGVPGIVIENPSSLTVSQDDEE
jgi:hypothetical protein